MIRFMIFQYGLESVLIQRIFIGFEVMEILYLHERDLTGSRFDLNTWPSLQENSA